MTITVIIICITILICLHYLFDIYPNRKPKTDWDYGLAFLSVCVIFYLLIRLYQLVIIGY